MIRALAKMMLDHLIRLKIDSVYDLLFLFFLVWPQQDVKVQISATSSCARAFFHFLQSSFFKQGPVASRYLESKGDCIIAPWKHHKGEAGFELTEKLSGNTGWMEVVSQTSRISWKRWYPEELVQSFSLLAHNTDNPTWPESDVSRCHR